MNYVRFWRLRRKLAALAVGTPLVVPGFLQCNFEEVTATTTLDTRDIVSTLIINTLIDPLEAAITLGVDRVIDKLSGEDDDA
jgi:hypothetical protein